MKKITSVILTLAMLISMLGVNIVTPITVQAETSSPIQVTNLSDLQSAHPYSDNQDTTWVYTLTGDNQAINVTFSADTQVEANCDYIYLYDGNDNQIGKYSGIELSGKTILIQGSTVKIRLTSDDSVVFNGFKVTSVVMGIWVTPTPMPIPPTQPAGTGTETDPYLIANLYNLNWVVVNNASNTGFYGKCFMQTTNIDISSIANWIPIGDILTNFKGIYDGNGYTISGIKYSGTANYIGLFGCTSYATIKNIGVINVNINSSGDYVGGLVGNNKYGTTITNSYSTGTVIGNYVGGLAGRNSGTITNSYSTGMVSGSSYVGGLVGQGDGTITNSYSTDTVSGSFYVGGLVGRWDSGSIYNCYYVDSHGTYGIGYNGLNIIPSCTQQIVISFYKTLSSYTKASSWNSSYPWDFTSTWAIDDTGIINNGYPYLLNNIPPQPKATPFLPLAVSDYGVYSGTVKQTGVPAAGDYTFNTTCTNLASTDINAINIIAVKVNGKLIKIYISSQSHTFTANETYEFVVPITIPSDSHLQISSYIRDGLSKINPLTLPVTLSN